MTPDQDPPARPPLVSVVTVCRDHRAGLARTHASLAVQDSRDIEWLVQDGGSTDGTLELLAGLAAPAADLRSGPDDGPFDAMNRAMARARGAWLLFLNAGDTLAAEDTLARLAAVLRAEPAADLVYGDAWEETAAGWRLKRARSHRFAWYGMFTHHQAMLYRRAAVEGLAYRTGYRIAADYGFTLEALARARRVRRIDWAVCRFEAGGLSQRLPGLGRAEQARLRRELLGLPGIAVAAIALVQRGTLALRRGWPALHARLHGGCATLRGGGGHQRPLAPLQPDLPVVEAPRQGEMQPGRAVSVVPTTASPEVEAPKR